MKSDLSLLVVILEMGKLATCYMKSFSFQLYRTVLVSYLMLIIAKEDLGIERTLGGVYFAQAR